ncbi:hypothetical protein [Paenibacillus sp. PDC88]|nr:hypothetical protein [Paenibacillus sp. PDC88]SDX70316.1 hypothetical protein SAMN05518848_11225 [Paenibacillus sp. PDC88]
MRMNELETKAHSNNKRKLELLRDLIEIVSTRDPIDYSKFNPKNKNKVTIEELVLLNEEKDKEVKALQSAWEELEGLLFNDLQITLQEKNQLATFLGYKKKEEKQKKQSRGRNRQVWRAD